jgi:hypothetical protein
MIKKYRSNLLVEVTTCPSRQISEKQELSAPGDAPTNTLQTFHLWLFQKI